MLWSVSKICRMDGVTFQICIMLYVWREKINLPQRIQVFWPIVWTPSITSPLLLCFFTSVFHYKGAPLRLFTSSMPSSSFFLFLWTVQNKTGSQHNEKQWLQQSKGFAKCMHTEEIIIIKTLQTERTQTLDPVLRLDFYTEFHCSNTQKL